MSGDGDVKALTGSLLSLAVGTDSPSVGPFTFAFTADAAPLYWVSPNAPTTVEPKPVVTIGKDPKVAGSGVRRCVKTSLPRAN